MNDAVVLETETLCLSLLPDRGADIYQLIDRESGHDVLFKAPWGRGTVHSHLTAGDSQTAWFDSYSGGWSVLLPNGGAACRVAGAELPFHGEASVALWEVMSHSPDDREIALRCRLVRSPLRIERRLVVDEERPVVTLHERVTNEGREPYHYLWAHHPTLGEALLDGHCRVDTSARSIDVDPGYDPPGNALIPGAHGSWPHVEGRDGRVDLSLVPPPSEARSLLAYLSDFGADGWYAVSNDEKRIGFALSWPVDVFPCAWFWQELNSSAGYPWYSAARAIAIEPSTTFPADGLASAIAASRQRTLEPGESHDVALTASLFRPEGKVRLVDRSGSVLFGAEAAQ